MFRPKASSDESVLTFIYCCVQCTAKYIYNTDHTMVCRKLSGLCEKCSFCTDGVDGCKSQCEYGKSKDLCKRCIIDC